MTYFTKYLSKVTIWLTILPYLLNLLQLVTCNCYTSVSAQNGSIISTNCSATKNAEDLKFGQNFTLISNLTNSNALLADYPDDQKSYTGRTRIRKRRNRKVSIKITKDKIPAQESKISVDQQEEQTPRKKYSTRVYLDKPAKFSNYSENYSTTEKQKIPSTTTIEPSKFKTENTEIKYERIDISRAPIPKSVTKITTATFTNENTTPVRYLLPPFLEKNIFKNIDSKNRGNKKFKDTYDPEEFSEDYPDGFKGNDLQKNVDVNYYSQSQSDQVTGFNSTNRPQQNRPIYPNNQPPPALSANPTYSDRQNSNLHQKNFDQNNNQIYQPSQNQPAQFSQGPTTNQDIEQDFYRLNQKPLKIQQNSQFPQEQQDQRYQQQQQFQYNNQPGIQQQNFQKNNLFSTPNPQQQKIQNYISQPENKNNLEKFYDNKQQISSSNYKNGQPFSSTKEHEISSNSLETNSKSPDEIYETQESYYNGYNNKIGAGGSIGNKNGYSITSGTGGGTTTAKTVSKLMVHYALHYRNDPNLNFLNTTNKYPQSTNNYPQSTNNYPQSTNNYPQYTDNYNNNNYEINKSYLNNNKQNPVLKTQIRQEIPTKTESGTEYYPGEIDYDFSSPLQQEEHNLTKEIEFYFANIEKNNGGGPATAQLLTSTTTFKPISPFIATTRPPPPLTSSNTKTSILPSVRNTTPYPPTKKETTTFGLEIAESKYFDDLPSRDELYFQQNNDDQVIPGVAGKDYPTYSSPVISNRRFPCRGLHGYFTDRATKCQVFYICNGDGAGEPMLCPNGTVFSQDLLVCDWWYNVEC